MIKILNEITYANARKILEVIYPSKPRHDPKVETNKKK